MKSEVLFEPVQLPVVKIAKEQVFGAKTSGEKQSFELFSRGQRSVGRRFAGVATLTKKPEDPGYEIVSRRVSVITHWPKSPGTQIWVKRGNTVNSLIVSTSHWRRRPHITVLFLSQMLFQKLSRKRPLIKFLNDPDHFFNQQFDIFCFLFPVSDHLAWSRMTVRKPFLECHKSSVSSVFDSADQTCWQLTYKKDGCITICR